jgi:CMP-N-acetylneuraminic acid synthetase
VNRRIAAIIPMRHESERVPGKNYRPLGGRPLFHHVVGMLLECPAITEVVIDTDSPIITDDARRSFPTARVVVRPGNLRDGAIPMNDVLRNDLDQVAADLYLQTHSTNPFLRAESVTAAIDSLQAARDHDSLFSVTRLQTRLWDRNAKPINHDPERLLRTQDMEPVFEENSCIYLFTRESFENGGGRIGRRPLLFEIARSEAWDIDTEDDFRVAEALYVIRGTT